MHQNAFIPSGCQLDALRLPQTDAALLGQQPRQIARGCESRGKPPLTHHNEAEILPERLFKQKQRDGTPSPPAASLTSSQRPRGSNPAPTYLPTYPPLSASLLVKLKSLYVQFFLDFNLATSTLFPTASVSGIIITCLCFSSTLPNCL